MNSEIKFRAFDLDKKIMFDVYEIHFGLNYYVKGSRDIFSRNFKLMQYTGLKDKNEIEIYEGDIVKGIDGHNIIIENIFDAFYYISMNQDRDCFEIIGNIHENPDLLVASNE